ncbi:hypothetical protein WKV44_08565 [Spirochaetia bacterium 38H-sp]|uniref:Tetratricopeptide repeat protein n=1 Tax=Rarispira pelagica TaxID=3141764 RepID=A0ABU9UF48_9SPIR
MDDEILKKIPKEGFLRLTEAPKRPAIGKEERVQLIRKGNELLNNGNVEDARRIFLTTDYKDGLVRIGDIYFKKNRFLDALKLYYLSGNRKKIEAITLHMAGIVKNWIEEGEDNEHTR